LECRKQGILFPGTAVQDSIDEERWGALYSAAFAPFHILFNAGQSVLVGQSACVLLQIEANPFGKLLQIGIRKRMLVVEDVIMHLPEFALCCSSLGSQSRMQGMRVNLGEREVAVDKAQLLPKLLLYGLHHPRRSRV
jgi:hypothetical protein